MPRRSRWVGSVLAAGTVLAAATPALSATFKLTVEDGKNVITMSGPSVAGDSQTFEAIADKADPGRPTIVKLSGPGGVVLEGMRIGLAIHKAGWATDVGDGHVCLSTCAITWLAGSPRIASSDAHIGFHAPFDKRTYQVDDLAVHVFKTYSTVLGLDPQTVDFVIAKSPGEGMDWIDPAKAKAAQIDMKLVPSKLRSSGRYSSAMVDAGDAEAARARAGGSDALYADLETCYAGYRKGRSEDQGFKCFGLELIGMEHAKTQATKDQTPVDPRFTMKAAVARIVAALKDTGHTARSSRSLLQRWQRDMAASASVK